MVRTDATMSTNAITITVVANKYVLIHPVLTNVPVTKVTTKMTTAKPVGTWTSARVRMVVACTNVIIPSVPSLVLVIPVTR